ncbi:hypothetical protein [uncultured Lacinutrix sp.]|uniref:hypothetical protein n=1 Tax=uncultured Lacinutrix sp. TaxID=574032 RepID=UPI00261B2F0B|nr:hypothetical protein [uncultured Lacinutrix sp.]
MNKSKVTVLALYPNRYGVGYALFDAPDHLIEYGIGYVQPVNNKKTIKKVRDYIEYYKPDIIITRDVNDIAKKTSKRIETLIDCICNEAKLQNLEIHSFTRTQIKEVFSAFKAHSKYQIALKLIEWFGELKKYQFPIRKRWMRENHNTGIFDATSLAMTYYYLK